MNKYFKKILTIGIISLHLVIFCDAAAAQERLVFAIDLVRHGDRTPINEIPRTPYSWKEGLGELTARGMNQEFQLGFSLREKYVARYHLLPFHYQQKYLYVRSTDFDRTLMSAQSFLLGLYPLGSGPSFLPANGKPALPASFQPIPIHAVSLQEDHLLFVKADKQDWLQCKTFYQAWQKKAADLTDKFKDWSKVTGLPLATTNPEKLLSLADTLYIRELYRTPLPEELSPQDAERIIKLGAWIQTNVFKCKEVTYPMGHAFLLTVADYLQQAAQAKTSLKYVLFFANDTSIMSVMTTLGAPLDTLPPYASDLNFALFKKDQQYFVRVSLNNKIIQIPGCGVSDCPLTQFLNLAKS